MISSMHSPVTASISAPVSASSSVSSSAAQASVSSAPYPSAVSQSLGQSSLSVAASGVVAPQTSQPAAVVDLSSSGVIMGQGSGAAEVSANVAESRVASSGGSDSVGSAGGMVGLGAVDTRELEQERAVIDQLVARDREVRAHEQAHAAAGGQLTGSPSYQYERGPDGVSYAVSGEVAIAFAKVAGDPEATLQNARRVQMAALAPADPSPQDRQVAAQAAIIEREALQEIASQSSDIRSEESEEALPSEEQDSVASSSGIDTDTMEEENSFAGIDDFQKEGYEQPELSMNPININLLQRLIETGAVAPATPVGGLLDLLA